ncbi:MAG: tyrosine-type recombinase/integrase [Dehalococcoidia bacterium]|jgi:integrase
MRGHIVKRYENSYSIILNLGHDPVTGKRKQQWVSVKGTKKEAEKRLAELLHQLDTGTFVKPGKTTLAEYLKRWLKDYAWSNLAPRTAEGYEHIVCHYIIPSLGRMTLTQLKPEHLQRYYSEKLSCGLSAQTVRHHHTVMHKALQTAVGWGELARNVANAVNLPKLQRQEMHVWGEDDIAHFLKVAKVTPYYALFYTALFTGMRRSELLALRWQDVDFMQSQLYVSRSLHCLKGGKVVIRPTKTAKGRRAVSLPPSATITLRKYHEEKKLERVILGEPLKDDDLVFSHPDGNPFLPNTVTHAWIKLVRQSGLKSIRLHDARHSHASLMLKQGIHPKVVQERLGHANISVTLDTYSHVAPGLQEAAAKRFDEAFTAKYNNDAENEDVKKFG